MPSYLFVSDDPETLHYHGIMLSGTMSGGAAYRVLFDHLNNAQTALQIVLQFVNSSDSNVTVKLIQGVAKDSNFVRGGHAATASFLQARHALQMNSFTLGSGATLTAVAIPIAPNEVACGLFDVLLAPSESVDFRIFACDPISEPTAAYPNLSLLGTDGYGRKGLFDIAQLSTPAQVDYIVGTTGAEFKFGDQALSNLMSGQNQAHKGEYGIVRIFDCTLHNASDSDRTIALYQRPAGGSATASYYVDNAFMSVKSMASNDQCRLQTYVVPKGTAINTRILTMPEINSSYPVALHFDEDDATIPMAQSA